jgi:serine/threonine protein kinase
MAPGQPTTIGRYEVERLLGEGGMGAVYLARDPFIGRKLAIKLMKAGFEGGEAHERFVREARSIGRLRHPNIVTIFDVGEHEGGPFIAMEFVEGQSLRGLIREGKPDRLAEKVTIIQGMCAGLAYAHRTGIVHRDIKPENVMVEGDGSVKILDFGIAREQTSTLTEIGAVMGTFNYMSPEQLAGRRVDHRADVFSVGAVAYELLSRRQAFPGTIHTGLFQRITIDEPESLLTHCPDLDRGLVNIVSRCLKKNPDERYADLDAVHRDLGEVKITLSRANAPTVFEPRPETGGGTPGTSTPRTPGPTTREKIRELRAKRLADMLTDARAARDRGDLGAARNTCQEAILFEPESAEAQDLLEEIGRLEQSSTLITQAREQLDRGALTAATVLLNRIGADVKRKEIDELRAAIERTRQQLEEAERRRKAIADGLARARQALAAGEFDQASAALADVAREDSGNADAASLAREVAAAREARRRAEEDARAAKLIQQAEHAFADGEHDRALQLLRSHRPPHALVTKALGRLEGELAEMNRRARQPAPPIGDARTVLRDQAPTVLRPAPGPADAPPETIRYHDRNKPVSIGDLPIAKEPPAGPAPPQPAPSRRLWVIGAVVTATAVVAVLAATFWPRPDAGSGPVPPPVPDVAVLFDIRPWAAIEAVTRASDGQPMTIACPATPCLVPLAPGEYNVRARNPLFPAPIEFALTVAAGEVQDVRRSLPDLQPEAEARRILDGR